LSLIVSSRLLAFCHTVNAFIDITRSGLDIIRVIKSRRMRCVEHVERMGAMRNADRVLVGTLEGRRSLGRPRRKWEDNTKVDLWETGFGEWIGFIWLRIGKGGELLWTR
jgi:hypothetical protein